MFGTGYGVWTRTGIGGRVELEGSAMVDRIVGSGLT